MNWIKEHLLNGFLCFLYSSIIVGWYLLGHLLNVNSAFLIVSVVFASLILYFMYSKTVDVIWGEQGK